ncbi:MAG TPA: hypothetical protein PLM53_08645 [Spirochaetota bacterium]|nr:hypothetical protein [Spirochaetota bacterium]HPC42198.1 hypothetical protein [Spirochaetota bacterium]HPL16594.1 hypothetical protein [Spirochaetota bacterium]HQF08232.1 hypothetical protein [Spirochaetota bacterium]HQH97153.1 hypothetical protein [Spirochaetota bacterium]
MYRELATNTEIHVSHNISKRFQLKRGERIGNHINDLNFNSKIELRYDSVKGVQ